VSYDCFLVFAILQQVYRIFKPFFVMIFYCPYYNYYYYYYYDW